MEFFVIEKISVLIIDIIYPVTKYEHRQGWHGGNMRNSLPGKPINRIEEEF